MYKMIAVDLDGTMLNSYGEVTENTKRVIKQTIGKGTDVIIASGRSIDSIKGIAQEIGSSKYMIAGNGAVVYDIKSDKIIYEKYIPKNKALDIIKICEQNSIYYNVYTNKSIIADGLRYNVLYYYKENLKKEDSKKTHITLVDNIKKYVEIQDVEILDVSHMSRKIIKHGTVEVPIEYYYTEISMQNVDKWYALEFLIDKLGIKKDEVIAIGDNTNDKKMIEQAGLGIIMKGSTPVVTEVADFVTDDNNNEGVAKAIERFIF